MPCTGIVVTASTGRQAGAALAAQQSQAKPARAAPESTKSGPVQQRAVALPKPLVSDQLRSSQTTLNTGLHHLHPATLTWAIQRSYCKGVILFLAP